MFFIIKRDSFHTHIPHVVFSTFFCRIWFLVSEICWSSVKNMSSLHRHIGGDILHDISALFSFFSFLFRFFAHCLIYDIILTMFQCISRFVVTFFIVCHELEQKETFLYFPDPRVSNSEQTPWAFPLADKHAFCFLIADDYFSDTLSFTTFEFHRFLSLVYHLHGVMYIFYVVKIVCVFFLPSVFYFCVSDQFDVDQCAGS